MKGGRRLVLAFRRIAQARAPFVSRGTQAGSYPLEQDLWQKAGIAPTAPWYVGKDARPARLVASAAARGAYVLADRSSLAPVLSTGQLQILLERVRPLRSGFHVMEVNPNRFPKVNYGDARAFGDYLLSPAAQGTGGPTTSASCR